MKHWAQKLAIAAAMAIAANTAISRGHQPESSGPNPPETPQPADDLKTKIAKMPAKARLAMSSVVGWSPIYDVEEIPLRDKSVYRITFDHQGHPAQVHIDQNGDVLDDPAVTWIHHFPMAACLNVSGPSRWAIEVPGCRVPANSQR